MLFSGKVPVSQMYNRKLLLQNTLFYRFLSSLWRGRGSIRKKEKEKSARLLMSLAGKKRSSSRENELELQQQQCIPTATKPQTELKCRQ